jgi:hypothetical protein
MGVTQRGGSPVELTGVTISSLVNDMTDYEYIYETVEKIELRTEALDAGRVVTETQLGKDAMILELAGLIRMIGFTRRNLRSAYGV